MIVTDMYDAIKAAGADVYLPAQAMGECRSERVVIEDAGVVPMGKTVGKHIFYVTGFVPAARSTDIYALMERVRRALAGMSAIRPTGEMSEGQVIDAIKAYSATAEYCAMCALK